MWPAVRGADTAPMNDHPQPARPLPELAPTYGAFRVIGLVLAALCLAVIALPILFTIL
jgi:hypothetical protein